MRIETHTVKVGEWLGDVNEDWEFSEFYRKHLRQNKDSHDNSVALFLEMQKALKEGKTVYAAQPDGFFHKVYHCGLYDGWPFWVPRPCYAYDGPIPGEHIDEYYNLRHMKVLPGESK